MAITGHSDAPEAFLFEDVSYFVASSLCTFDLLVRNRSRGWDRAIHSGTSYLQFWHSECEGAQSGTLETEAKCHMRSHRTELGISIQALSAFILEKFNSYQAN